MKDMKIMIRIGFILSLIILMTGCSLEYPCQRHILDISDTSAEAQFVCPKHAHHFRLVIGIPFVNGKPDYERKPPVISGTISIVSGTNIVTLSIKEDTLHGCNWLPKDQHLDGFIVDWPKTITNLVAGQKYDIRMNIDRRPQTPLSLWMEFLSDGKPDR